MKYSEASLGRAFILRLEDGDVIHEAVEGFAAEKNISAGLVFLLGGAGKGSRLVVGPKKPYGARVIPMETFLNDAYEIVGLGTLFKNEEGKIVSHIHVTAGRRRKAVAGCIRRGVRTWVVAEVVIIELTGSSAKRVKDPETGFELLEPF